MTIRIVDLQAITDPEKLGALATQFRNLTTWLEAKRELEHCRVYGRPTTEAEHKTSTASQELPDVITW